jgi:hypothetical protein
MERDQRSLRSSRPLEGRYANYFDVGYNAFEFILNFGQFQPEGGTASQHTRIVTGPVYAKLLATMLADAVAACEREHGPIRPAPDEVDPLQVLKESIADFDRRARACQP